MIHVALIAAAVAAASAAAAKSERGLEVSEPTPPTWKDRCADVALWAVTLLPGVGLAAVFGGALHIIFKIAFAKQGIEYP